MLYTTFPRPLRERVSPDQRSRSVDSRRVYETRTEILVSRKVRGHLSAKGRLAPIRVGATCTPVSHRDSRDNIIKDVPTPDIRVLMG